MPRPRAITPALVGSIVEVIWVDALTESGWSALKDVLATRCPLVHTWGKVLAVRDHAIVVSGCYADEYDGCSDINQALHIPTAWIRNLEVHKKGDRCRRNAST